VGFMFWAGDGFLWFIGKLAKVELGIPREGWNERESDLCNRLGSGSIFGDVAGDEAAELTLGKDGVLCLVGV
jgi:hypothetical protein